MSAVEELQLPEVEKILEKNFPGNKARLLFASVAGSRSFNLNLPDSDADLFGVYVLDSSEVISSIPLQSKFKAITSHDPDYVFFEVHSFCELLLKGNPKVIEPLFQTHLCHYDPAGAWSKLIRNRQLFLNSTVISQYKAFAASQLQHSSQGKGSSTKKYYHALRLLREATRMTNFENPAVWIEGDERDYLMSIRRNQISTEILDKEVEERFKQLDEKLANPKFLAQLNKGKTESDLRNFLHPWLVKIRRETLPRSIHKPIESKHPLFEFATQELEKQGVKGDILCCCLSGKDLHCNIDNIQQRNKQLVDYIAVYAARSDDILGLCDTVVRVSPHTPIEIRDTYTRGIAIHEVSNICTLIQQGNHRILEILFSDRESDYVDPLWLELRKKRNSFITQVVANHYQGVGRGQLVAAVSSDKKNGLMKKQLRHIVVDAADIEDTSENRVKLYHSMRLLSFGNRVVLEHSIPTSFAPENRKVILGIISGTTSISEAVKLANMLCKQIEELKFQLKSVPRRIEVRYAEELEYWLIQIRSLR